MLISGTITIWQSLVIEPHPTSKASSLTPVRSTIALAAGPTLVVIKSNINIIPILIFAILLVNIVLLILKRTHTLDVDIWNYHQHPKHLV
jgi:hypothetical protein